jgi:hypothetical protein
MALRSFPTIILVGFENAGPEPFQHIHACREKFMINWAKGVQRIHATKALIGIFPNQMHYRIWGTDREMFIELLQ